MLFERIESEGIAHYSYLLGHESEAVVIDPRRDCSIYVDLAYAREMRITHILETHRNEDYVIGSVELAGMTGAEVWHADSQLEYRYGLPARDGQEWRIGRLMLRAISAPGHTAGMMSYLLYDDQEAPWVLFTGDALFAGDVGRVDLVGKERLQEMAGLLYDSIFHKFLPLGDGIIACPSHGSGSVCAASISDRAWTTIGLERQRNPKLRYATREQFVEETARNLEKPPYFVRMEKLNIEGAPVLGCLPVPPPLDPDAFEAASRAGMIVDTRRPESFGASHIPGALSIWLEGLPSFAGWFLPYETPLFLVTEEGEEEQAARYLVRLGYDALAGRLSGGMLSWHRAGKPAARHRVVTVQEMCTILDGNGSSWILDVRSGQELEKEGTIPGAHHIHITELPGRLEEIPHGRPIYIFCGSGLRSTIAASLMQTRGWEDPVVVLGGFAGWSSVRCPVSH